MKKEINLVWARFKRVNNLNLLIFVFFLSAFTAHAQDTLVSNSKSKWNFLTEVYLLFPYMNGDIGIGQSLTLPIDAGPGDIFKKAKMGAMLYGEARKDKWAITSDVVYMNLNQPITPTTLLNSGSATIKLFYWEVSGLYRVTPYLEVGAGGRYNYLQTSVDALVNTIPDGTDEITGRHHKIWVDPIIIARYTTRIKEKWMVMVRGDMGGFSVGSKFTWQLQAYAGYRFSKLFQLTAGYRIVSIDYSKGRDPRSFLFDANLFGPVVRFGFNF